MSWRSPKLIRAARGKDCVLCGRPACGHCHANSVALGKGRGIKAPDYYGAWLCLDHHHAVDGHRPLTDIEEATYGSADLMWQWAYVKTIGRWFELGIVEVK